MSRCMPASPKYSPPASKEAVEHAADVARQIVERAAHAHVGQAHLKRATVEQIATSAG